MSRSLTVILSGAKHRRATPSFVPLPWIGSFLLVASPVVAARRVAVPASESADAIR